MKENPDIDTKNNRKPHRQPTDITAEKHARERAHEERKAHFRKVEQPIITDLRKVGVVVESVADIRQNMSQSAIPILLKHLNQPYEDRVRKFIAVALGTLDAKTHWSLIVNEYKSADKNSEVKNGLAFAIKKIARPENIPEIIDLARDRVHGTTRALLIDKLRRSKNPLARNAIVELSSDPEIGLYITDPLAFEKKILDDLCSSD